MSYHWIKALQFTVRFCGETVASFPCCKRRWSQTSVTVHVLVRFVSRSQIQATIVQCDFLLSSSKTKMVNCILLLVQAVLVSQSLNLKWLVYLWSVPHIVQKKLCTSKKGGTVGDEWSHLQRETTWQLLCLAREGLSQLQRQAISLLLCENTFSPYSQLTYFGNHVMLYTTGKNCPMSVPWW